MSLDILSLPTAIFTHIWDFCGAKEIMAMASTCRLFKTCIGSGMLVVDAKCSDFYYNYKIPVFFKDDCHSVFMTCDLYPPKLDKDYHRLVVMSRKRQQHGDFDTLVWERTIHRKIDTCHIPDISFRNDPSREYLMRYELEQQQIGLNNVRIRKQFMMRSVTPTMQRALHACLAMGLKRMYTWSPMTTTCFEQMDAMRLFMKLYVLNCLSSSSSGRAAPFASFLSQDRKTQAHTMSIWYRKRSCIYLNRHWNKRNQPIV